MCPFYWLNLNCGPHARYSCLFVQWELVDSVDLMDLIFYRVHLFSVILYVLLPSSHDRHPTFYIECAIFGYFLLVVIRYTSLFHADIWFCFLDIRSETLRQNGESISRRNLIMNIVLEVCLYVKDIFILHSHGNVIQFRSMCINIFMLQRKVEFSWALVHPYMYHTKCPFD